MLGLAQPEEAAEDAEAEKMLQARAAARKEKNWKESDRLRDALRDMGYIVEDTPQGQKLRRA